MAVLVGTLVLFGGDHLFGQMAIASPPPGQNPALMENHPGMNLAGTSISLGGMLITSFLVWKYYRLTVSSDLKYRTFWPRFWEGSVDGLVFWPLDLLFGYLLDLRWPGWLSALLLILSNTAWIVYTVVLHKCYGQTIGKMVTRVKVVDHRTEGPISWRQACLRDGLPLLFLGLPLIHEVALLLSGVPYQRVISEEVTGGFSGFWMMQSLSGLWLLAELITMLTNEKRRALHDFIGGTVVIRTNAFVTKT
ncbi:MAG: RDD family protein [Chthoniobacteraceae bacterium]